MRALKQVEPAEPTPEQLLSLLDSQLLQQRARRQTSARNRVVVLAVGLLVLITAAAIALMTLFTMLNEARPDAQRGDATAVSSHR